MPEASNSLPKRKRGGQPGNRNRLVHGRYTQAETASRADIRTIRRKGRALVILVDNVLKARKALKRRRAACALAADATAVCSPHPSPRRKALRAPVYTPFSCHGPPSVGHPDDTRSVVGESLSASLKQHNLDGPHLVGHDNGVGGDTAQLAPLPYSPALTLDGRLPTCFAAIWGAP